METPLKADAGVKAGRDEEVSGAGTWGRVFQTRAVRSCLACWQITSGRIRVNQGRENEAAAGWALQVLVRTSASTLREVGAIAGF